MGRYRVDFGEIVLACARVVYVSVICNNSDGVKRRRCRFQQRCCTAAYLGTAAGRGIAANVATVSGRDALVDRGTVVGTWHRRRPWYQRRPQLAVTLSNAQPGFCQFWHDQ